MVTYTQVGVGSVADDNTGDDLRAGCVLINTAIQGLEDHENDVTTNPHAVGAADVSWTINSQGGATYTVAATDRHVVIWCTRATAMAVNLEDLATLGSGFEVMVARTGAAGAVTITASGPRNINGSSSLVLSGTYDSAWLINDGTEWFARVTT